MYVTMITFLCPFLLESPRLNIKLLWKLGINSNIVKATYLIALLHISNENMAYSFEISRYIKYFETIKDQTPMLCGIKGGTFD